MRPTNVLIYVVLCASAFGQSEAQPRVVHDFAQEGFERAYSAWDGKVMQTEGATVVRGPNNGGGLVNRTYDLTGWERGSPALILRILSDNTDEALRLTLRDADGTAGGWDFPLTGLAVGELLTVPAANYAALAEPTRLDPPGDAPGLDLAKLTQFHLQGAWRGGKTTAVALQALVILPYEPAFDGPRQKARAEAEAAAARQRQADEQKQAEEERLRQLYDGSRSDAVDLTPASDRILVVHFDDGWVDHEPPGLGRKYDDVSRVHQFYLNIPLAEKPETWLVTSPDDPGYAAGVQPLAVGRKTRGTDFLRRWHLSLEEHVVKDHWLYLQLPKPLQPGRTYVVKLDRLARNTDSLALKFEPAQSRSETVHVNQLGYVPSATHKYGYLSHFMGSLGRLSLDEYAGQSFHLVDQSTGRSVFEGPLTLRKDFETGDPDSGRPDGEDGPRNNWAGADVWQCDFSDFRTPGEYVLAVDGIGCSFPFRIADDVYRDAFYTVARGLYHERAGVAKDAPYTRFDLPRDHHPDDGFVALLPDGTEFRTWGWYHDGGDWDPYPHHSRIAAELLFAYQAAPHNFVDGELKIPESGNGVPDILDTAAWQVEFMRRSIGPQGGVIARLDFGPKKPDAGLPSWADKTVWKAWPETAENSFRFAAIAAELAYCRDLAAGGRHPDSAALLADAIHQYGWAQAQFGKDADASQLNGGGGAPFETAAQYAFAAAALYKATGQAEFQDTFRWLNRVTAPDMPLVARHRTHPNEPADDKWDREWATWSYALIDPSSALAGGLDRDLHTMLREATRNWAEHVVVGTADRRSFRNGYDWTMPHVFGSTTTPWVAPAIVAYAVTGDEKYRSYCQMACDYYLGGNPLNMVWVTGLGDRSPQQVLHHDSWHTGLSEMVPGIVPYGPLREGDRGTPWFDGPWDNDCGRNTAYPYHKQWPIEELWFENRYNPQGNEFTCSQNLAPAAAAYGFLCATATDAPRPNQSPLVTLTSPSTGHALPVGTAIQLSAEATDADGRVARVEFYDGRHLIGRAEVAPFTVTWTPPEPGEHQLSAVAVDDLGCPTFSADRPQVTVTVSR